MGQVCGPRGAEFGYLFSPYSVKELNTTKDGGTPYGASHVGDQAVTPVEEKIAYAQGKRLAELTIKLRS